MSGSEKLENQLVDWIDDGVAEPERLVADIDDPTPEITVISASELKERERSEKKEERREFKKLVRLARKLTA